MSAQPVEVFDVAAAARWYRCVPCEVTWRDTTPVCWSCESQADAVPHHPDVSRDQARSAVVDAAVSGSPLTRFGPRVSAL